MEIVINTSDSIPLFTQLIDQIKRAVLNGELKPGSPLPSIRQLANDLELNHNTVAKAYRLLERDSVIQTRGYRGTIIHPDAKANSTVDLSAWVISKLSAVIKALRDAGVTDSEIRIAFRNVMSNRNK
ncbi:GntR family transcriptional regulator [bacterium]|nr:GntR family transcriptional regulator [bacterium]